MNIGEGQFLVFSQAPYGWGAYLGCMIHDPHCYPSFESASAAPDHMLHERLCRIRGKGAQLPSYSYLESYKTKPTRRPSARGLSRVCIAASD